MELQMKLGPQHRQERKLQLPEQPQQQKPQRPSSSFSQSIPVNGVKVAEEKWVISIRERLEQAHLASSRPKFCIYRVPEYLQGNDNKAFIPQVVSLGPYHHKRNESLCDMEEHKLRSLDRILKRTSQDVKLYLDSISEVEVQARNCYVGPISHTSHEFVYMMVLDGCFTLEIFQGAVDGFEQLGYPRNDPIFAWRSVMHTIRQDMVMLENQIPLFILDRLLELQFGVNEGPGERPQAAQLALRFLDSLMSTDETVRNRNWKKRTKYANTDLDGLHCLDLLRRKPKDLRTNWMRWKPQPLDAMDEQRQRQRQQLVRCATELRVAGVKFKKRNTERFWDVKFKNGTLCIPRLLVHDGTKSLLLNMKAYEHCHTDCGNEVTSYLILMDNLINSDEDVKYLHRRKILEHWLGSNAEVAEFFNSLCQQVAFDFQDSYISKMSADVNNYCDKRTNEWLAIFSKNHCRNPWTIISLFAGVVFLLLTFVQTFYTVYGYYRPS
ncbi:UPF0481 protein At3g47200-like [Macadamia integrifolia]|uniref:UPF0481 protein At3g47200-like n=1 Tax=Macadamia integrifolia TaxID=60698 RepID=UPI001C529B26|nr:UPF0481 protein At3g47200-like [Macadamia integrifolia]